MVGATQFLLHRYYPQVIST